MKKLILTPKRKKLLKQIIFSVLGLVIGFTLAFPFIWMLICSFYETASDLFQFPPRLPNFFNFKNFADFIQFTNLFKLIGNTMILVLSNMVLSIGASTLVAYGFARFNAKGKNFFFILLLSTMMLPWVVTMVPAYMLFSKVNLVGTYLPLILPSIGGSAFYIFMMRQFFMGIPKELDEAAKIDGCSSFGILWRIHLPNCWPILATMVIFNFNGIWSDYVAPSIYILDQNRFTLALGLQQLKVSNYNAPPWHQLMAGSFIYALPMILVYIFCQKAFVRGVVTTGIK
jgi:multiple sugar transport system permease protein